MNSGPATESARAGFDGGTSPTCGVRSGIRADGTWSYRPGLDGLRTIAVYVVVAFHAAVPGFGGGFIGVDLFFVLSGFLVTNVLLTELADSGRLRFSRFYSRRFRRLLPAAAVVVAVSAVAMVLATPVTERFTLVGDARSALLYFANWHFVAEAQDYFGGDAESSPFLHFWSLSIEEQFYFVFPITLVGLAALARRTGPTTIPIGLGVLGAVSVGAQLYWASADPLRAYYGSDARLYQMLAGACLAASMPWVRERLRRVDVARLGPAALIGFVVASMSWFDVSPSRRGLVAAVLSVAIVLSLEIDSRSRLSRWLSTSPVVRLGQVSYGTYLWHWPIIVGVRLVTDVEGLALFVFAAVSSTVLADLSARVIERPIRKNRALDRTPRAVICAGLAISLLGALSIPSLLENQRTPIVGGPAAAATSLGPVPADIDWREVVRVPELPDCTAADLESCRVAEGEGLHVLLLGDSHARTMIPVMERFARANGFALSVNVVPACGWFRHVVPSNRTVDHQEFCASQRNGFYEQALGEIAPDVVVAYQRGHGSDYYGTEARSPASTQPRSGQVTDERIAALPIDERVAALTLDTAELLTEDRRRLIIIEPTPDFAPVDPANCLARADDIGQCLAELSDTTGVHADAARSAAALVEGVEVLDLTSLTCPEMPTCVPIHDDGVVVWRDAHHVSLDFWEARADELSQRLLGTTALGPGE